MDTNLIEQTNELIADMDLPINRKDLSKVETTKWLLRNLGIRNAKHKNYEQARVNLVVIARQQNCIANKELRRVESELATSR